MTVQHGQQWRSPDGTMQHLILRTDSDTLSPVLQRTSLERASASSSRLDALTGSSAIITSSTRGADGGSGSGAGCSIISSSNSGDDMVRASHQKRPSASSMSSTSSASTSSKTAAFFAASQEAAIRPARSSSTSLHTSNASSTSRPSSPQLSPSALLSHNNVARMSWDIDDSSHSPDSRVNAVPTVPQHRSSSSTASSSHNQAVPALATRAPFEESMEMERSPSSASTSFARRSWMDFEAKSITPLPSPGTLEGPQSNGEDAYRFPSVHISEQIASFRQLSSDEQQEQQKQHTPTTSAPPSSRLPSYSTPNLSATELVNSPKTSHFFGAPRSSHPYFMRTSVEGEKDSAPSDRHALKPRLPSSDDDKSVYAPSRYPSVNAEHPTPGRMEARRQERRDEAQRHAAAASSEQNVGANAATDNDDRMPSLDRSAHPMPRLVLGTQPMTPTAFVSPPSPIPGSGSSPSPTHEFTRHTQGPSENVTDSSILPAVRLQHMVDSKASAALVSASTRASPGSPKVVDRDASADAPHRRPTPSSQTTLRPDETEDELTGRVGCFDVERVLGMGAFSRVVLARRRSLTATSVTTSACGSSNLVALKMLEKEPCRQNERMRVSWVREVEVLKHIVHPNVVRFITSFSTYKHHVLVLETVEGGELFEYLAHEQMELAQREWLVRKLFGELANAVGWMHSINLVHRDIKLENIILTNRFRAIRPLLPSGLPDDATPLLKLSDFGLSRFVDPQKPHLETRCGSEEYAAPELIIGKRYDGRQTDVWAMGVVLYALLSGSLPFLSASGENESLGGGIGGMANTREDAHGAAPHQHPHQVDARARKAHLLRIAKGDLRWPSHANDACLDVPDSALCPPQHRLITPPARLLVARLLRRDAQKRAVAWEVWDEAWMRQGSFDNKERSAQGHTFRPPLDPRSPQGQAWLSAHARVQAGAPDVVRDD